MRVGETVRLPGLLTLELHMPGPTVLDCILSDARCAISKDSISGENSIYIQILHR